MRSVAGGRREALVRWKDFGHHGDTWEPEEHVFPKAKITNFLASAHEELPLRWYIMDAIAQQLTSRKIDERGPRHMFELPVEKLSYPGLAAKALEVIRIQAGPGLQYGKDIPDKHKDPTSLQLALWQPDQISKLVALHISRPHMGLGALRIKCGSASYTDMMLVAPPLILSARLPREKNELPTLAGCPFIIKMTTVVFNGLSGMPDFPAIRDASESYTFEERCNLVEMAREELAQPWSVKPVPHPLLKKGWHNLPSHKWALKKSLMRFEDLLHMWRKNFFISW